MKFFLFLSPFFIVLFLAFFAPFLSPYAPNLSDLTKIYEAPNLKHFFGTDMLGRDLFSRILYALRNSAVIGILSSFLAVILALIYVFVARICFYGLFMRSLDMILALPSLLLMMFFQGLMNGGLKSMIFIIVLTHFAYIARVLESELKQLENADFYKAALVLGMSKNKAFFKELLPCLMPILAVFFILNIAHAIGIEATLSFFGLGLGFEIPSLGNILNEANKAVFMGAWWIISFPLLAILMLILPLFYLSNFLQKRNNIGILR